MLRKTTLLALAATAVLGLVAVTPDFASARGHGGHGGHGGRGAHGHHGHGHHGHHGRGHRHGHRHEHRRHWHVRWHRQQYVRPYYYAVRPALPGPCTCLSKEYTPDGAVLCQDRCSNEMAMYPPAMAPQQTGALDQPQSPYAQQYVQPQPQAR
jgi:hypothetical protein